MRRVTNLRSVSANKFLLFSVVALAAATAGCGRAGEKDARGATADAASVVRAIKADEAKWNEDFHAKNRDALLAHYTADAYFVAPDSPAASSPDAIRKVYEDALKDATFDASFGSDKVDVAASGDLAYSRGRFTAKMTNPTTKKMGTISGSYLAVYKRQADGNWKVVEDVTAVEPPKEAAGG